MACDCKLMYVKIARRKVAINSNKCYYLHHSAISVNDVSLAQLQEITL